MSNGIRKTYLADLPSEKLATLGQQLDADEKWISLAKNFPGEPYGGPDGKPQLRKFAEAQFRIERGDNRPRSPGIALLRDLQNKSKTLDDLIVALEAISHKEGLFMFVPKTKPRIVTHPTSRPFKVDETIRLDCVADGFPRPQYQWFVGSLGGGAPRSLQGQMWSCLEIKSATREHAGSYCCRAKNEEGYVFSHYATVQIIENDDEDEEEETDEDPPLIKTHPQSVELELGSDYQLACMASGSEPITYQWFKGSKELEAESGRFLQLRNVRPGKGGNTGQYLCQVKNRFGSGLSDAATVKVIAHPQITLSPDPFVKLKEGDPLILECKATGHPRPSYQWYKDGKICGIEDAKEMLVRQNVTSEHAGRYYCVITNNTSVPIETEYTEVIVTDITFRIRQHPRSQSADIRESVCLSCLSEESNRQVTYQWYKEKERLRNELLSELNLIVDEHNYGEYSCSVLVDDKEVLHSKPALIWPYSTIEPIESVIDFSKPLTLSCFFKKNFPYVVSGYQWRRNNDPVRGQTSQHLSIARPSESDLGEYTCDVVTEQYGILTSKPAIVAKLVPPKVESESKRLQITLGESLTLTCNARGKILSYQWERVIRRGDRVAFQPLVGRTEPTLTIEGCHERDSGEYRCVVLNGAGEGASGSFHVVVVKSTIAQPHPLDENDEQTSAHVFPGVPVLGRLESLPCDSGNSSRGGGGNSVSGSMSLKDVKDKRLQSPEIVEHPRPEIRTALEGAQVMFSCKATGSPTLVYEWYQIAANGTEKRNRGRGQDLVLNPVKNEDAGSYYCIVMNHKGSSPSSKKVQLAVIAAQGPPRIIKSPKSLEIEEGREIRLECQAVGQGKLQFDWIHDEKLFKSYVVAEAEDDGTSMSCLTIRSVKPENGGKYRVTVRDQSGRSDSKESDVTVHRKTKTKPLSHSH